VRQTLLDILEPVGVSLRQMISSESLASAALAEASTAGAFGSWITPPGGAEPESDLATSAPAGASVAAGAGGSEPEEAHAPMQSEIATIRVR